MEQPLLLLDESDQDMAPVDVAAPPDVHRQPEVPRQHEHVRAAVNSSLQQQQHVRLPELWVSDPNMWFAQAESWRDVINNTV
jgi:hypothetical protein